MDNEQKPLVSICCLTFNHAKFVRKTIDSFLMQKVDFTYEIIIHDDASTDNTAEIIREYEIKHPIIIKPIYQTENQHTKGIRVSYTTFKVARGKYIAFCEGDDYWIDPYKLQKQVKFLESHPECTICGHAIKKFYENEKKFGIPFPRYKKPKITDLKYLLKESILSSVSIMFRSYITQNLPDIFFEVPFADLILKIICAEKGKIGFINEVMAIYRVHNKSMTQRKSSNFSEKQIINIEKITEYLNNKKLEKLLLRRRVNYAQNLYGDKKKFKKYMTFLFSNTKNLRNKCYLYYLYIPRIIIRLLEKSIPNYILFVKNISNYVKRE